MRPSRLAAIALLATLCGACAISEQSGELGQSDLVFHFDSTYNLVIIWARSAALVLLAVWVYRTESIGGRRVMTYVIGIPAVVVAAWLLYRDLPLLHSFRLELRKSGLLMHVPPAAEREIEWGSIEQMHVSGYEWQKAQTDPRGQALAFTALPDWKVLELTLAGGEVLTMDLERLSVEQRGTFFRGIAHYGHMTKQ